LTYTPVLAAVAFDALKNAYFFGLIVGGYCGIYIFIVFYRRAIATRGTLQWLCAFFVGGAPAFAINAVILTAILGFDFWVGTVVALIVFSLISVMLVTPLRLLSELRMAPRAE
jgi:hypothetical protein